MIAPLVRDDPGQQLVRDLDQRGDVGVDHPPPIIELGVLRLVEPGGEAGVVDEQVDWPNCVERGIAGGGVADVEAQAGEGVTQFGLERVEPVGAAAGADHPPASAHKRARGGLANAGGGAGDEGGLRHCVLPSSVCPEPVEGPFFLVVERKNGASTSSARTEIMFSASRQVYRPPRPPCRRSPSARHRRMPCRRVAG